MGTYNYEALKNGNERTSGKIEADSIREARDLLRKQGLMPVKLNEVGAVNSGTKVQQKQKKQSKKTKINKMSMRETIDFTNILYTFLNSGISLIEALFFMENNVESENMKNISVEIRRKILAGDSLSKALESMPGMFNEILIGLIKAGEDSGELEKTFKRLAYLLDKQDKLKSKIISTLAYPVFVLFLALIITIVLLAFVFPEFKKMYDQMGTELPFITVIFMAAGEFLKEYWFLIPFMLGSIVFLFYFILNWEVSKRFIDKISLKIPVVDKFVRLTSIANFILVLRIAFEAGITMVDSLMLANFTVPNIVLKNNLKKVIIDVQYGKALSASLKKSQVFPGIVMCMISTGEETGSLSEMLKQAGDYVDDQIDLIVDILSKMLEPILFLFIGGIVLTLGLALYLPLFDTYANM